MTRFVIDVSNEKREIDVYVNESGNLVLNGIGSIVYDMLDEELILSKTSEIEEDF